MCKERHNWRHRQQTRPCHFPQSNLNFHELDEIESCWFRDQRKNNFLAKLLRQLIATAPSNANVEFKFKGTRAKKKGT